MTLNNRVPIRVPRVRSTKDRDIPLRSYDALSSDGEVNDLLVLPSSKQLLIRNQQVGVG